MKAAFGYLAAGIGIGAAVGILLAPSSGMETRKWMANKCLDAVEAADQKVWQSRFQVREILNRGQQQISKTVAAGREAVRSADGSETPAAMP